MGNIVGTLIQKLRTERGMSQDAMALAAGVARDTIGAVEQGRNRRWHPETARRIFRILMQVAPIPRGQAYELLDALGLTRALYHTVMEEQEDERSQRLAAGGAMQSVRDDRLDGEAQVLLDQLKATVGAERTVVMLRAILATETARRAAGHRMINVRQPQQPSRLVPGAVEEQITTYEQADEASHTKSPSKPRASKIG